MYYPLEDLLQLSRVAPELTKEIAQSSMSLALALHQFCRDTDDKLDKLPEDVKLRVKAWQQLLTQAQGLVSGLKSLPAEACIAIVQVAEVFARPKPKV